MNKRILVIGMGGAGCRIVSAVRNTQFANNCDVTCFVFDFDQNELNNASADGKFDISSGITVNGAIERLGFDFESRWFYRMSEICEGISNCPSKLTCGGFREKAYLAFNEFISDGKKRRLLDSRLDDFFKADEKAEYEVILTASLAGTTGCALILPVFGYIKKYAETNFKIKVSGRAELVSAEIYKEFTDSPEKKSQYDADSYATVSEINGLLTGDDGKRLFDRVGIIERDPGEFSVTACENKAATAIICRCCGYTDSDIKKDTTPYSTYNYASVIYSKANYIDYFTYRKLAEYLSSEKVAAHIQTENNLNAICQKNRSMGLMITPSTADYCEEYVRIAKICNVASENDKKENDLKECEVPEAVTEYFENIQSEISDRLGEDRTLLINYNFEEPLYGSGSTADAEKKQKLGQFTDTLANKISDAFDFAVEIAGETAEPLFRADGESSYGIMRLFETDNKCNSIIVTLNDLCSAYLAVMQECNKYRDCDCLADFAKLSKKEIVDLLMKIDDSKDCGKPNRYIALGAGRVKALTEKTNRFVTASALKFEPSIRNDVKQISDRIACMIKSELLNKLLSDIEKIIVRYRDAVSTLAMLKNEIEEDVRSSCYRNSRAQNGVLYLISSVEEKEKEYGEYKTASSENDGVRFDSVVAKAVFDVVFSDEDIDLDAMRRISEGIYGSFRELISDEDYFKESTVITKLLRPDENGVIRYDTLSERIKKVVSFPESDVFLQLTKSGKPCGDVTNRYIAVISEKNAGYLLLNKEKLDLSGDNEKDVCQSFFEKLGQGYCECKVSGSVSDDQIRFIRERNNLQLCCFKEFDELNRNSSFGGYCQSYKYMTKYRTCMWYPHLIMAEETGKTLPFINPAMEKEYFKKTVKAIYTAFETGLFFADKSDDERYVFFWHSNGQDKPLKSNGGYIGTDEYEKLFIRMGKDISLVNDLSYEFDDKFHKSCTTLPAFSFDHEDISQITRAISEILKREIFGKIVPTGEDEKVSLSDMLLSSENGTEFADAVKGFIADTIRLLSLYRVGEKERFVIEDIIGSQKETVLQYLSEGTTEEIFGRI